MELAKQIYENLKEDNPDDAALKLKLANVHIGLGDIQIENGRCYYYYYSLFTINNITNPTQLFNNKNNSKTPSKTTNPPSSSKPPNSPKTLAI